MNQKIKIMKPPPQLSDDEIRSFMDFETLLKQQEAITSSRYRAAKWLIGIAVVSIGTLSVYVTTEISHPEKSTIVNPQKEESTSKNLDQNSDTTIPSRKDTSGNPAVENDPSQLNNTARTILPDDPRNSNPAPSIAENKKTVPEKTVPEKSQPKDDIYLQAEPVDGYELLYEYFNKNLKYPSEAMSDSVQGRVMVMFVVTAEGKPDQIKVVQNLGTPFEKEVVKLIEQMPLWKPATLNGKAVPSKITLPLTFQIQRFKQ
jgi:TonB family protein